MDYDRFKTDWRRADNEVRPYGRLLSITFSIVVIASVLCIIGAIILFAQGTPQLYSVRDRIRALKVPIKIMLSVSSCNVDEMETKFLQAFDAVVPLDFQVPEFLDRLEKMLASPDEAPRQDPVKLT